MRDAHTHDESLSSWDSNDSLSSWPTYTPEFVTHIHHWLNSCCVHVNASVMTPPVREIWTTPWVRDTHTPHIEFVTHMHHCTCYVNDRMLQSPVCCRCVSLSLTHELKATLTYSKSHLYVRPQWVITEFLTHIHHGLSSCCVHAMLMMCTSVFLTHIHTTHWVRDTHTLCACYVNDVYMYTDSQTHWLVHISLT